MRFADILGLALSALWQQKVRTLLTTLGVVFGAFVLAASLSIGQGIQDTIERESHRTNFLRRIEVWPEYQADPAGPPTKSPEVPGEMTDARRARLRRALIALQQRRHGNQIRVAINREKLRTMAALEHVEMVVPSIWQSCYAILENKTDAADAADVGAARQDDAFARQRIVAGRYLNVQDDRSAVVSEILLYRCGIRDEQAVDTVLGKKIQVETRVQRQRTGIGVYLIKPDGQEVSRAENVALAKVKKQLPDLLASLDLTAAEKELLGKTAAAPKDKTAEAVVEEFTIVGVARRATPEELKEWRDPFSAHGDVLVPPETATDLFFRVPGQREIGVHHVTVIVDREENVKDVARQVSDLGLRVQANLEFIERDRLMYLLIFGAMTCVSGIALLIAALGIANTMLMSVLERTREIGIMKAVGAGNGQLQLIFLVEGAWIGLVGGGLGLLLAWAASHPLDIWVRSLVTRDLKIELTESIFVFPFWLTSSVMLFAVVVTTLAAVYPARRAAKVDPVAALRHE